MVVSKNLRDDDGCYYRNVSDAEGGSVAQRVCSYFSLLILHNFHIDFLLLLFQPYTPVHPLIH